MGNCCRPFKFIRRYSSRIRNRKIVLLLVGLDNAGKSCAAKGLSKEPVEDVVPTVGFNSVKLIHRGHQVIIYDLGGGKQIRDIWHRYFADVHGVIFVVDASDRGRLDECKNVLTELLKNEKLAGKPVLMLANKQDKEGALDELDIVERLNVEQLVNSQQCPTLVETCSAAAPLPTRRKRKLDSGINNGYKWLLRRIISDYDDLNARVLKDQEEQKEALALEREARRIRIKEERRKRGDLSSSEESSDHENNHNPDPFQPIHMLVEENDRKEKQKSVTQNGGPNLHKSGLSNGNITGIIDLESHSHSSSNRNDEKTVSAVEGVKEQFRQKSASQKKKRNMFSKNNKTAPLAESTTMQEKKNPTEENFYKLNELPPIKSSQVTWAQISSSGKANGAVNHTETCLWDLGKSLEVVMAPNGLAHRSESPSIDSDANDVVVAHIR
ncbi:ADP-ribosylation factor-like protein 13B [Nilaparvata lugens]|uniref:ADP-ribosylation factor-like protein 13B n=1 Tax=Nilaparvata lugens TaxID=108931 RepID=UPI00193DCAC7|nr:ADP-ribosylation factor-like protein 13B [Nilaparvata lugens]